MSSDSVITVEGVSKKFCKSLRTSMVYGLTDIGRNLVGMSSNSFNLRKNEFWAVNDVSFEVKRGETVGLIGQNGCGKTTMLKMLNGIFWPDKGKVTIKGSVGALIAVGAGFHPLLTGRENIYINGAILGMTKTEIDKCFDAIVDFADIGSFLDSPVKHYSSGMFVRLGFSIAVHSQAEILLVDEVLAVGDRDFQIKCYQKMAEVKKRGVTIILVSHNDHTIREECSKCVYIQNGQLRLFGPSEEAINLYIKDTLEQKAKKMAVLQDINSAKESVARIVSIKFYDNSKKEVDFIESGQELDIVVSCQVNELLQNPVFGVNFYDNKGFMYCANSEYENVKFNSLSKGEVKVTINIPHFHLPIGNYLCSVIIAEEHSGNLIDWQNMTCRLNVGRAKNSRGSIKLPTRWDLTKSC